MLYFLDFDQILRIDRSVIAEYGGAEGFRNVVTQMRGVLGLV